MSLEILPPLSSSGWEIAMWVSSRVVFLVVVVASYRRSRCLSGYPVWRSALVAVFAGAFFVIWVIAWIVNHERIAEEWREHHRLRRPVSI